MLNSIESYAEAGRKAAQGMNRGDHGFYQHWAGWYRAARNLEKAEDKQAAEMAYLNAYKDERYVAHR